MGMPGDAVPVLIAELVSGAQRERLYAANALEEIDEGRFGISKRIRFRQQIPRRVIDWALNEMLGTDRTVP